MTIALVLFALAAVGGLVMAIQRFSGKPVPPLPLALVHGAAAASGLVALIVVVSNGAVGGAKIALILFAGAALGGFYLFECKDLDEALTWAAQIPEAAFGAIEVRPVMNYEAMGA